MDFLVPVSQEMAWCRHDIVSSSQGSPAPSRSWLSLTGKPFTPCRAWLTVKAERASAHLPGAQQLFPLAPCSTLLERGTEWGHVAYSLPVGSGLIGSKEVEGLGRTELLSSEAEDCSGCVSSPAVWPLDVGTVLRGSRSPLLLGSATETLPSAKSRTHENVICDQPPNKQLRHRPNPHLQC